MEKIKHGDILPEDFRKLFPEDVYELIVNISRAGYGLTLVGGAVRDYFLNQSISHDLDFELRHNFEYSKEEWIKMITRLGETLKNKYSYDIELLPFEILKIKLGSFDIELSSPRTEVYSGNPPYGHSEFEVELDPKLDYSTSFLRRDFTINALGVEFGMPGANDEFKFVDPYGGRQDLEAKILRPCSEDFYKDPVRFLRLIRFSKKFGFGFEGDLSKFDLSELTPHYFFQECMKNFFPISRIFFELIEIHKINLAIDLKDLSFLKNQNIEDLGKLSKIEILVILTFMENSPSEQNRSDFARLAGMRNSSSDDYYALKTYLKGLSHISDGLIKNKLRHNTFVELLDDADLLNMKALHQIYNRHRFTNLDVLENINPDALKVFNYFKSLFGEETKGKKVAEKLMNLIPHKEKRSVISIYCHLLVTFDLRPVFPESRFGS